MNGFNKKKRKHSARFYEKLQLQIKMRDSFLLTIMGIIVPVIVLGTACVITERNGSLLISFGILWALSIIFSLEAIVLFLSCLKGSFLFGKKLRYIYPLVLFFLAIWVIRFDVSIHTELFSVAASDGAGLNFFEHVLNSMVHAFQSFSMDEDYSSFLTDGKDFVLSHMQAGTWQKVLNWGYGAYCAFINVLAALAGGAVLLKILTNAFPGMHLRIMIVLHPDYTTYVFSELNERSVLIAESIYASRSDCILVFTDAYTDETEEADVEIRMRAMNIQGFCLQDDISILKRLAWGPVKYYLIDNDEKANITSFADFFSRDMNNDFFSVWEKLSSQVEIYVFAESPMLDPMIQKFNKMAGEKSLDIFAKPIDVAEIMSYDLLREYPLYRCLQEKKDPVCTRVNILLVGDTPLIHRFIQNASWCGQFLNPYADKFPNTDRPVRVHPVFHILCQDKDLMETFISTTMNRLAKKRKETSQTYAEFDVREKLDNLRDENFMRGFPEGINYCLIDTGDDLENLFLGEELKRRLDMQFFMTGQTADILCVVRDAELNSINSQLTGINAEQPELNVRRYYVGNFAEQYQIDNIEHSGLEVDAFEIHQGHSGKGTWNDLYTNLYNYRSSKASALHYQYRLFSAGVLPDWEGKGKWAEKQYTQEFLYRILGISLTEDTKEAAAEDPGLSETQIKRLNLLFWLEKNRWNAYMYGIGYREPSCREMAVFHRQHNSYELHKDNKFSNETLHLHGCLMDLKEAIGIPMEKIRDDEQIKQEYDAIREKMERDFQQTEPSSWPEDKMWPDYLEECHERYWKDFCIKHEIQMDILDIYSAFRNGEDYKLYDFKQVPILGIDRLKRYLAENEKAKWSECIADRLGMLAVEGNYLWNIMKLVRDEYAPEKKPTKESAESEQGMK